MPNSFNLYLALISEENIVHTIKKLFEQFQMWLNFSMSNLISNKYAKIEHCKILLSIY